MGSPAPAFSWSDAWLLHAIAIASARRPASLGEIIATGDAIEKSAFSFEELSSGAAKLQAAGHVRVQEGSFELLPPVRERLLAEKCDPGRAWFTEYLKATPWSAEAEQLGPDPSWRHPGITREAVASAFSAHQIAVAGWFEEWLKKNER